MTQNSPEPVHPAVQALRPESAAAVADSEQARVEDAIVRALDELGRQGVYVGQPVVDDDPTTCVDGWIDMRALVRVIFNLDRR